MRAGAQSAPMIRFTCVCGKDLKAPAEYSGKRAVCPRCKSGVVVPPAEPENVMAYVPGLPPPGDVPAYEVVDVEPEPEREPMPLPEPEPESEKRPWPKPPKQRRVTNAAAPAASLILALIVGAVGGGIAAAVAGFVGGAIIAKNTVAYDGGPGQQYDEQGKSVHPTSTAVVGACCLAPVGCLVGAAAGCLYIKVS